MDHETVRNDESTPGLVVARGSDDTNGPPSTPQQLGRPPRRRGLRSLLTTWSFLLPSGIFIALFLVIPLFQAGQLSLYNWDGVSNDMDFVGAGNYTYLLTDQRFMWALIRTIGWLGLHVGLAAGGGFVLAVLIAEVRRGQNLFRTVAFIPYVLSLAVVGVIWGQLYHPAVGLVNGVLEAVGLGQLTLAWLGEPNAALPAVGVASGWQAYGFYMVIFLAGIQNTDPALHEAAMVDGASMLQRLRHVTIPSLHNTISLVLVLAFIHAFRGFGTVWAMTQGGPGTSTELLAVYVWREAFQGGNVSRAATAGILMAALVVAIATPFNRRRDRMAL